MASRLQALLRLQKLVISPAADPESGPGDAHVAAQRLSELRVQLHAVALRQLADEDWHVVSAALQLGCLQEIAPAQLSATLQALQARIAEALLSKDQPAHVHAAAAAAKQVCGFG